MNKIIYPIVMMLTMMMSTACLTSCGGDDDESETKANKNQVYPDYIIKNYLLSGGYSSPDFSSYRGYITADEVNYMFRYQIKLVDSENYKYEFIVTTDEPSPTYGNAEIVYVTDSKYNFSLLWNIKTKEYDIVDGYFKGGKIEITNSNNDGGIYDSATNTYHPMKSVTNCIIRYNGLEVSLGTQK